MRTRPASEVQAKISALPFVRMSSETTRKCTSPPAGALAAHGFAREDRPFSGHVTLGRVRQPGRDERLAAALAAGARHQFGRLAVDRLALMRSELSPRGARYSITSAWPLLAAPSQGTTTAVAR